MLEALGYGSVEEIFTVIPKTIRDKALYSGTPSTRSEYEVVCEIKKLAARNLDVTRGISFLGGGSYDHHVPAAVRHLLLRSEFYTAYTPYQPEVSQGTLQAIFEFQSLICSLTGMSVVNASHYDGATALAEGVLMAMRQTKRWEVLVSEGVNPRHRAVLKTYLDAAEGSMSLIKLGADGRTAVPPPGLTDNIAAIVLAQPNAFGCLEDLAAFRASIPDALFIVQTNPVALGLIKPPGVYGADIVVGDAQSIGGSLSYGGPALGYMAVTNSLTRQLPGRIVGKTVDVDGREAFVLTLQAREQHIRRHRAASNICTNQALIATAATIHLTLLGPTGLKDVAETSYHNAHYLVKLLKNELGIERLHQAPFFNEFAVDLKVNAGQIVEKLAHEGFLAGIDLRDWGDGLETALLIAVTETRTRDDMIAFVQALGQAIAGRTA